MAFGLAGLFCAWKLGGIVLSYIRVGIFGPSLEHRLAIADPHAYVIFARDSDVLLNALHLTEPATNMYGSGMALMHAALRYAGLPHNLQTAFLLGRGANILMALALTVVVVKFWRGQRRDHWQMAAIAVVLASVLYSLLLANGANELFANLSAARYLPIGILLVAAAFFPIGATPASFAIAAFVAAIGIALFYDIGTVAALGYGGIAALQSRTKSGIVTRGLLFVALTAVFVAVLGYLLATFTPIDVLGNIKAAASAGLVSFGGLPLRNDKQILAIAAISIFETCRIIAMVASRLRPSRLDALSFGASIMLIVWLSYYIHRPYDYFIFPFLAIIPLSNLFSRANSMGGSHGRIAIIVLFGLSFAMAGFAQKLPRVTQAEQQKDRIAFAAFSGLAVAPEYARSINTRIAALPAIGDRQAHVITGIPFAVATSGWIDLAPVEILFGLCRHEQVERHVAGLLNTLPATIVLDDHDTPAWGREAVTAIGKDIEAGISGAYELDDTIPQWRVWRRKQNLPPPI